MISDTDLGALIHRAYYDPEGTTEDRIRAEMELDLRKRTCITHPAPEGFRVVYKYKDNIPYQDTDYYSYEGTGFDFPSASLPKLPLRACGSIVVRGWDIPIHYAVDANGNCFMDNAHGGALYPCSANDLLAECEDENMQAMIRRILEMKPALPQWVRMALDSGWTPPPTFDISVYEA